MEQVLPARKTLFRSPRCRVMQGKLAAEGARLVTRLVMGD